MTIEKADSQESLEDIVRTWDIDRLRGLSAEVAISQEYESGAYERSIVELIIDEIGDFPYYPERVVKPGLIKEFFWTLVEKGLGKQDVQRFVDYYFGEFASHYPCDEILEKIDISLLNEIHHKFGIQITLTKTIYYFILHHEQLSKACFEYLDHLIDKGVELDDDEYPIMELSGQCEMQIVKYLVSKGGDINIAIEGGADPFLAMKSGIPVVLEPNRIGRDDNTQLTRFIYNRRQNIEISELELFKISGADFNKKDGEGNTPLSIFMLGNCDKLYRNDFRLILEYLIENGADINGLSHYGRSPLMDIMGSAPWIKEDAEKYKKSIETLISMGASISRKNNKGETAFHLAVENDPKLLDVIRPYLDRKPTNLVEALLFDGSESVTKFLSGKRHWSSNQITKTFEYALRLRDDTTMREILKRDPNVLTALNALLERRWRSPVAIELVRTTEISFRYEFLRYVAQFNCMQLRPLWEHLIAIDDRKGVLGLAEKKLTELIGAQGVVDVINAAKDKKEKELAYFKRITSTLENRVRKLFESLQQDDIFAINIWGEGWAPGDHGWEKVFSMLTKDWLKTHNISNESDVKYCYTDLRYFNKLARHGGRGPLRYAINDATIYYGGPSDKAMEYVARKVVRNAEKCGLVPKWSGNTSQAIELILET